MADIERRWDLANGKPLLAKDGELYVSYLNEGGEITIKNLAPSLNYTRINPKTDNPKQFGKVTGTTLNAPDKNPWILLVKK